MELKMPIIDVEKDIKSKKIQFVIKRFLDIILSLIGIIVLSPIYLILFLWIRLDSKGPALFKQVRVGKDKKNFVIYKFRTMVVDAEKKKKIDLEIEDIS
ncbi:sugar transferase, partial [Clostridium sporogenes]|uniref:sugar transferase n=1 Tax=Clostridium sporogenes TaxID=1509 RepID=UPI00313DB94F